MEVGRFGQNDAVELVLARWNAYRVWKSIGSTGTKAGGDRGRIETHLARTRAKEAANLKSENMMSKGYRQDLWVY